MPLFIGIHGSSSSSFVNNGGCQFQLFFNKGGCQPLTSWMSAHGWCNSSCSCCNCQWLLHINGNQPNKYLQDRDSLLRDLSRNLRLAQERMTSHANQWRREVSFEVGDYVYLKLQPYRQTTVAFRSSLKLSPQFYGPFQILSKVGLVAYRLDLLKDCQIHNVFHVSLLRKHLGSITPLSSQLPPLAYDSSVLPQPASILARCEIQKGKYRPKAEVLLKWVGASEDDATWENE